MNGAHSLLSTLVANGVDVCFANPGTSEMHFVAALDTQPQMRCVLGLAEGVVTGAADGYGRMAGTPAATLLHLGPGLGNGLANLHNAKKARTPVVNIVGDHASHHRQFDAPLTSDVEGVARPVSGWVRVSASADEVAADGAAAVQAALAPPGQVATLILPADTAWNRTARPPAAPLPRLTPDADVVVIGIGGLGHMAVQILKALTPARLIACFVVMANVTLVQRLRIVPMMSSFLRGDITPEEVWAWRGWEASGHPALLLGADGRIKRSNQAAAALAMRHGEALAPLCSPRLGERRQFVRLSDEQGAERHYQLDWPFAHIPIAVLRDNTEAELAQRALERQLLTDELTGKANRRGFDYALDRAGHGGGGYGVFFLDMNGFKTVNDTHGHDAGDELLVVTAQRLAGLIGPQDTVARLGGDEFAVVIADLTSDARAAEPRPAIRRHRHGRCHHGVRHRTAARRGHRDRGRPAHRRRDAGLRRARGRRSGGHEVRQRAGARRERADARDGERVRRGGAQLAEAAARALREQQPRRRDGRTARGVDRGRVDPGRARDRPRLGPALAGAGSGARARGRARAVVQPSSRSASVGAMRAARRAGTNAATNATSASSSGIAR